MLTDENFQVIPFNPFSSLLFSHADDEEVHNLKDHHQEEMARLLAKHEAELKSLKEKRQKKKQAQLAKINKRLQQRDEWKKKVVVVKKLWQ